MKKESWTKDISIKLINGENEERRIIKVVYRRLCSTSESNTLRDRTRKCGVRHIDSELVDTL
jgi:hypothetical protein